MQCVIGIKPFDMIACVWKYRYTLKQIIIVVCFGIKVVLWPQKLLFLGELHKDSQHDVTTTTTLILMSPIQPFPIIMLPLNSFGKMKNAKNEVKRINPTFGHYDFTSFSMITLLKKCILRIIFDTIPLIWLLYYQLMTVTPIIIIIVIHKLRVR